MTKQRELILQILTHSDRHLTADEVFFLAKLQMPSIAMATVYNNLNAMTEAGMISRVHVDGSADCFEKGTEPHDHLRCTSCGKLANVSLPWLKDRLFQAVGTDISGYDLTVHYICPECRRKG
ncbi:MAG: transcriptional repressor [Clostridia bacterium]|nr:transcriptional repressor [Clostridia bacterium]